MFPLVSLTLFSVSTFAAYDPTDRFTAYVEMDARSDSNVFNIGTLPAGDPLSNQRKDSLVFDSRAGMHYDYPISRQDFFVNMDVVKTDFQHFSPADYNGHHNNGGWNWGVGDHLSGLIQYSDSNDLSEFNHLSQGEGDLQRQKQWQGSLAYQVNSSVSLIAMATNEAFRHDQLGYLDLSAKIREGGVKWSSDKGVSLTLVRDVVQVNYLDDFEFLRSDQRGYNQYSTQLQLMYPYSQSLSISASTAAVKVVQDFDGSSTKNSLRSATVTWLTTAKSRLVMMYQKQFDAPGGNSGSTLTAVRSIQGAWQFSAKTSFNFQDYIASTHYGAFSLGGERNERVVTYRVGMEWSPEKSMVIDFFGQKATRSSPLVESEFSETQIGSKIRLNY